MPRNFNYRLITGVFVQDNVAHVPSTEQILPKFGLIGDEWPDIDALNANAAAGINYKLIFAGRHGQGFHNVAERNYPTDEWERHWSRINTDGELVWGPDALLTELGVEQAKHAASQWATYTGPRPALYLCSPLRRTLHTFSLTFKGSDVVARVREGVRERVTGHTCDYRSKVSELKSFAATIEGEGNVFDWSEFDGIEEDPSAGTFETYEERDARVKVALDTIFANENANVVSITTHAGFIRGLDAVLGRPDSVLPTGGIAPFLVEAVDYT
ncbi:phosphoglycerate mutase-like protein [Auriculariales sp. MPI-PUGE-AT-0066]|nr:phosphoglycerate mutase-like protein [Auriculariales sp. MPI-PUGE-AT-0066]